MFYVKVEIGTSSPTLMSPDDVRKVIRQHLKGKQFKTITLDDERWMIKIETMSGAKVKMSFPDNPGDGAIEVALS